MTGRIAEGLRREYKRSFDREAIETLCAFANTRGGTVFIGVDNAGRAVGVTIGPESVQEWINQVKIFNDRITVYNPGCLPPGITVANLLSGKYVSTPRNRQIAEVFKEAGMIEKYGSGIARVCAAFRASAGRDPVFEEIGEGFMVTVFAASPPKDPPKGSEKGIALTAAQERVLAVIRDFSAETRHEIAQRLGVSPETVKEHIAKLKRMRVLRREGGRSSGHWVVDD